MFDPNFTAPLQTFIYAPTTGPTIFARYPVRELAILTYRNEAAHVIGGRHLQLDTATRREWWRSAARRLVQELLEAVGGIGWDVEGQIHLVVPTYAAPRVAHLIEVANPFPWDPRALSRLHVAAGSPLDKQLRFVADPRPLKRPDGQCWETESVVAEAGKARITIRQDGQPHEIRVPVEWMPAQFASGYNDQELVVGTTAPGVHIVDGLVIHAVELPADRFDGVNDELDHYLLEDDNAGHAVLTLCAGPRQATSKNGGGWFVTVAPRAFVDRWVEQYCGGADGEQLARHKIEAVGAWRDAGYPSTPEAFDRYFGWPNGVRAST